MPVKACGNCGFVKPVEPVVVDEQNDIEPKQKKCKICNQMYEGSYKKHTDDDKHKMIDDLCKFFKTLDDESAKKAKEAMSNIQKDNNITESGEYVEPVQKKKKVKAKDIKIQFN